MRRLVPVEVIMEKELSDYYEICNFSDKPSDIEWIVDSVLEYTGWTWVSLYEKSRNRKIDLVTKRGIIDLIANCNDITYTSCGKYTNRDHSLVIHSVKLIEEILDSDRATRNLLREIMEAIRFKIKIQEKRGE